ncbi:hypothetical protein SCOCK_40247 [Actinacidiphila cocklensis]|uniref:Uncharacterized protein n=1 Tax=Actinacidiphila cocklensis TaxID=887465 RepID=A0A9W4DRG7_9ACTN|nr:hypothetical protein SCOCK_40247 [Actinacidiphila cocklensis]
MSESSALSPQSFRAGMIPAALQSGQVPCGAGRFGHIRAIGPEGRDNSVIDTSSGGPAASAESTCGSTGPRQARRPRHRRSGT